jgi:hypothetical protein
VNRAELVSLVREVLGDVEEIRTARNYHVQLQRGTCSLTLTFIHNGGQVLSEFLVPLPWTIMALIESEELNPYNSVTVKVSPTRTEGLPQPQPVSGNPEGA